MARYYSAETAVDYKVFLEHFKKQAQGNNSVSLLPSYLSRNAYRKNPGSSIVIIDRPRPETTSARGQHMPSIEIVDESEASRRRAESELEREIEQTDISTGNAAGPSHSTSAPSAGRTGNGQRSRKRQVQLTGKARVKRVKDLFDN